MKKIVALLLAALMMLTSVAALASAASPAAPVVTVDLAGVMVTEDDATVQALLAAIADSDVYANVDAETADALKAIFGDAEVEVNEAFAIISFDVDGEVTLTITFPTPYAADAKVALVIKTDAEEIVVEGVANVAGAVVVTLDADTVAKIKAASNPIVLVVSAK